MSKINPQPKELTLEEALKVTNMPLKRWGDLITVQVHEQLRNHSGFSDGEMRSTFMPSRPDRDGNFERNFPQPDTENYLRDLYKDGGRLESVAEFSNEALALYFDYRGGIFRDNGWAGDVGEPSRFVSDCKESSDQINQPTRNEVEAIRKTVLTVHKKDRLAASHGEKFKPPELGSLSPQAEHIHNLARDNRTFSAKELQNIADKQVIGEMGHDAFRDHVTAARKIYPKEKKPRRKSILRD